MKYRPEIDGLRAVAVLSVLFYHAGLPFISGGYVGVDVFFVISGFLITSLLWHDLTQGVFSLKNFYERRCRRILPPLFFLALVVTALAWFYLLPFEFKNFGRSLTAAFTFWANVFFWRQSGYFDAAAVTKPLLHTWSLSVEEQFYILFPLLIWGLFHLARRRVGAWLVTLALFSLAASVVTVKSNPDLAFYFLHTRAWELLAGSIIAVWVARHPSVETGLFRVKILSWIGLAAVVLPVFVYDHSTAFPGWAALPPCVGAGLIIYSLRHNPRGSLVGRWLASRPMVGIGKISYSLYLWHWPLLAIPLYVKDAPLTPGQTAIAVAGSLVLAYISWRFVEQPVRNRVVWPSRRSLLLASLIGVVILAGTGRLIRVTDGFPGRLSGQALVYASSAEDSYRSGPARAYYSMVSDEIVYEVKVWEINPEAGAPVFALWGDSHARMWRQALEQLAVKHQVNGLVIDPSGCRPDLLTVLDGDSWQCGGFNQTVVEMLKQHQISNVLISIRYSATFDQVNSAEVGILKNRSDRANSKAAAENFGVEIGQATDYFNRQGLTVWFLENVPEYDHNVVNMLTRAAMRNQPASSLGYDVQRYYEQSRGVAGGLSVLAGPGFCLLPTAEVICSGGWCSPGDEGGAYYTDTNHLTNYGALKFQAVFNPFFNHLGGPKPNQVI